MPLIPDNPAGEFQSIEPFDESVKTEWIETIRLAPERLRRTVAGLSDSQLDTKYKNWTIRQITHHLADSHLNSLMRFKWALNEDAPTIKAYEEDDWVQLADCKIGDIDPALAMLDGLHAKWVQILGLMAQDQYARIFHHPQSGEPVSLWAALNYYAWHGRHHTAQIQWLREQNGWDDINELHVDSIRYVESTEIPIDAVIRLYRMHDWSSANKPQRLERALRNSHSLVSAWDGDNLVGLANSISDGHLVVYYPHAVVHPDYQRRGIGQELMSRLKRRYKGFHQHSVLADKDAVGFYERCGFRLSPCPAMWIYDGDDHG